MSSAESPEVPDSPATVGEVIGKTSSIGKSSDTKKTPSASESEYSGLRNLQEQKEKWSNLLRWVLVLSFFIQVAMLVGVLVGRPLDDWTVRAVLLQFTAMFIASLRFLFR